jgi:hypothetical protein
MAKPSKGIATLLKINLERSTFYVVFNKKERVPVASLLAASL